MIHPPHDWHFNWKNGIWELKCKKKKNPNRFNGTALSAKDTNRNNVSSVINGQIGQFWLQRLTDEVKT